MNGYRRIVTVTEKDPGISPAVTADATQRQLIIVTLR